MVGRRSRGGQLRGLSVGSEQRDLELFRHRAGYLRLHREDILQFPVVGVGPDIGAVAGFDQRHRDAHPIGRFPHAAFEQIKHAELFADRLAVVGLAFELKRGGAPDDLEVLQTRERRDEFFRHAVGEVLVSRIAGGIDHRQHRDRFFGNGEALRSMRGEIICRAGGENRDDREGGDQSGTAAPCRLFDNGRRHRLLKFLRNRGVAQRLGVEIDQMEPDTVLDLALTEVAQPRRPLPRMDQIIRHMLGEKNVAGVAAIHHPLRHVDAGPGDVGASAHVGHLAHRSAVNAHPHRKFGVLLERFGNLECAPGRFLRAVAEDQRHPVAGRQPDELFVGRFPHRRRRQRDFNELVQPLLLLFVQEFGVTDDVDEQDMPDLQAQIVGRHRADVRGLPAAPLLYSSRNLFIER